MATKEQELRGIGCFHKAAPDEPLFILRANDPLAPSLVRMWAQLAHVSGLHENSKAEEAALLAGEMDRWRLGRLAQQRRELAREARKLK